MCDLLWELSCLLLSCAALSCVSAPGFADASGSSQQGAVQQRSVPAAGAGSTARTAPAPHALLLSLSHHPSLTKHIETPACSGHVAPLGGDTQQLCGWLKAAVNDA